jgi:hypothetical protein
MVRTIEECNIAASSFECDLSFAQSSAGPCVMAPDPDWNINDKQYLNDDVEEHRLPGYYSYEEHVTEQTQASDATCANVHELNLEFGFTGFGTNPVKACVEMAVNSLHNTGGFEEITTPAGNKTFQHTSPCYFDVPAIEPPPPSPAPRPLSTEEHEYFVNVVTRANGTCACATDRCETTVPESGSSVTKVVNTLNYTEEFFSSPIFGDFTQYTHVRGGYAWDFETCAYVREASGQDGQKFARIVGFTSYYWLQEDTPQAHDCPIDDADCNNIVCRRNDVADLVTGRRLSDDKPMFVVGERRLMECQNCTRVPVPKYRFDTRADRLAFVEARRRFGRGSTQAITRLVG